MWEVISFLVGIHFMMMILAAIYRISDLWYRIADFWVGIITRLVVILVINAAILWLLSTNTREAFLWGQAFYLSFHVSAYWITRLGLLIVDLVRR